MTAKKPSDFSEELIQAIKVADQLVQDMRTSTEELQIKMKTLSETGQRLLKIMRSGGHNEDSGKS